MPAGYVIQIRREALGAGPATSETVCVLGDDTNAAIALVKTALRLGDETVQIVRTLSGEEARQIGLKPFQVKHLA